MNGWFAIGVLLTTLFGCGPKVAHSKPPVASHSRNEVATNLTPKGGARLVLTIVLDQFPSWALERYREALPADGLLRRGMSQGVYYHRVEYQHALTLTAPGHAALFSGEPPAKSGIFGNQVFDKELGRLVPAVYDPNCPVIGDPADFACPTRLTAETVGDRLETDTRGRAKVVSLSSKDRAAIFSAGQKPDLVLWYSPRLGRFTSSTFYGAQLPAWLRRWQGAGFEPWPDWDAEDRQLLERFVGADDAPGEGDFEGLGTTFVHHVQTCDDPKSAVRATPLLTEKLLQLALLASDELELGQDDIPDLLSISVSSTDYVGHVFGDGSWEYLDNLIRVDRALAALVHELERRTSVSVLISSDHGVAPVVERRKAKDPGAERIQPARIFKRLDKALREALGDEDWVAAFSPPFVVLGPAAESRHDEVTAKVVELLKLEPAVYLAVDVREAAGWAEDPDPIRRAVALSVGPGVPGDVYVVFRSGRVPGISMVPGRGTTHGSPWDYDRQVPVIFWRPGVEHREVTEPASQLRVAATIAELLGLGKKWAGHEPL